MFITQIINTEVFVKGRSLFALGALAVVTLVFGAIGCTSSNPVAPAAVSGTTPVQTIVKDGPSDSRTAGFKLYGDVIEFYPDKSLLLFSSKTASDRSASPVKYSLFVSGEAVVVLLPDRETVAFDSRYVPEGSNMTVFGSYDRDGTMIVDRIEVGMTLPGDVSNSSAL
jgi:hypothetical protein